MPQNSRITFVLIASGLSISLISSVQAQQGPKAQAQQGPKTGQRQVTPTGGVKSTSQAPVATKNGDKSSASGAAGAGDARSPKAPPVDPVEEARSAKALDAVLAKWESESTKIKSLHGTQYKSEFNDVFQVEKISKGPFFFEKPDRGRIDFLAVNIPKGKVSDRKDPTTGKPFELTSSQAERWICNGTQIIEIMEEDKTYMSIEIPEEKRGANIIHTPLPFLFGIKAEEAKSRFDLKLHIETANSVVLLARPKMAQDQQNYKAAEITLNKKNHYLPEKVRMVDQGGQQILYRFEQSVINDSDFKGKMSSLFGMKGDPFNPNLKDYQMMVPPEDPIEEREKRQQIRPAGAVERPQGTKTSQATTPNKAPQAPPRNSLTPTSPRK